MEEYVLYLISNFSLEVFLMSICGFLLTMAIKIPIKKATSSLSESKRKGLNSLIILIPIALGFLLSLIYFAIYKRVIISLDYLSCSLSVGIMSISIYLIYSRVKIIIKSFVSNNMNDLTNNTTDTTDKTEESNYLESGIQKELTNKLQMLIKLKQEIESQKDSQKIVQIRDIEEQKCLENEQEKHKNTN